MRNKRKGIVLITTLLFVTIIVMIATMVAAQGKAALQSGTASMQAEEAYMAALSGIDVVRGELKRDKAFGATSDNDFPSGEDNMFSEGLKITYNGRNIIGKIGGVGTSNDYKSKFVISFSKTNNDSVDNSVISNNKHVTDEFCRYLSVNNLNSTSDVAQDFSKGIRRGVPPNTIYIVSKGVCGKAVRYAEAFLTSDGPSAIDGGSQIGGNINIIGTKKALYGQGKDSGYLLNLSHVDGLAGQLTAFDSSNGKADKKINLNNDNGNIEKYLNLSNEVYLNSSTVNGKNTNEINNDKNLGKLKHSSSSVAGVEEIKSLNFDNAKKDLVDDDYGDNKLAAGCYVYLKYDDNKVSDENKPGWIYIPGLKCSSTTVDKETNRPKLDYSEILNKLNDDGSDYATIKSSYEFNKVIKNGNEEIMTFGKISGYDLDTEVQTVTVSGNVTANSDVNFVCVDYKPTKNNSNSEKEEPKGTFKLSDSSVDFNLVSKDENSDSGSNNSEDNKNGVSIINSGGKINIAGEVTGRGSLLATGDVNFNAGSNLEVGEQKVAVYSGGNVNIEKPKDVSMKSFIQRMNSELNVSANANQTENTLTNSQSMNIGGVMKYALKRKANGEVAQRNKMGNEAYEATKQTTNTGSTDGYTAMQGRPSTYFKIEPTNIINNINDNDTHVISLKCLIKEGEGEAQEYQFGIKFTRKSDVYGYKIDMVEGNAADKIICLDHYGEGKSLFDVDLQFKIGSDIYSLDTIDFGDLERKNPTTEELKQKTTYTISGNNSGANNNEENKQQALKQKYSVSDENDAKVNNAITSIASNLSTSSTNIKGTMYSKGDININAGNYDVNVTGAFVSLGGLNIYEVNTCNLMYDPNYVPFFKEVGINTNVKFVSSFVGGE